MATKKLSPNMENVLLAAASDDWIRKSDAPTHTAVALIDRKLIGYVVYRRANDSDYSEEGHWLTDAGKAKVAELRGDTTPAVEVSEIRAGDLIEIRQSGKRAWAMRVERLNLAGDLVGKQVRMVDGKPGRNRVVFAPLKPGEYTIIERAKPVEVEWNGRTFGELTADEKRRATKQAATQLQDELTRMAPAIGKVLASESRSVRVTATVADDDNVPKLSKAQIDGLHFIGAPDALWHLRYERPSQPTIAVLRRMNLVAEGALALTEAGRAAYLANKPTGRMTKRFNDAWRTAQARIAFGNVAAAVEAACDRRELEIDEANEELTAKGPVKVIVNVEANPSIETYEIDRAEWDAMTPGQRYKYLNGMAMEDMNNAGGCGWHIEDAEDAAMVGIDPKPELPTLEVLMMDIARYGEDCFKGERYRITDRLMAMRRTLEVLYREAGR
jgi:hypothetical protein